MTKKVNDNGDIPQDNAWTSLLSKSNAPEPVIIQIEKKDIDMEISTPGAPATPASMDTPRLNDRKANLLSSFHRNLRMSIKAVADSPGHFQR